MWTDLVQMLERSVLIWLKCRESVGVVLGFFFKAKWYHQKGGRLCVCVIYMQQKPWRRRRVFRGLAWRFTPAVFVVWLVMAFTTARTESSSRWGTQLSHHNSAVVCNKASLDRKRKDNVFGIFFFFSILTKLLGCRSHQYHCKAHLFYMLPQL